MSVKTSSLRLGPGGASKKLVSERLVRPTGPDRVIRPATYADASGSSWTREAAEASLELSRSERRLIQRGLAAEGFDPGPADGLFGRGTRGAIRAWQASRGEAAAGYLNADAAKALLAAGEGHEAAVRAGGEHQGAQTAGSVAARQLSERLGLALSPVAVDENGWTDLHRAAVLDLPELAVTLLNAGANPDAALKDDGEPLGDRVKEVIRSFGHDTFATGIISDSAQGSPGGGNRRKPPGGKDDRGSLSDAHSSGGDGVHVMAASEDATAALGTIRYNPHL